MAAQYFSAFLRPVLVLGCLLHLTLAAAAATGAASIPRPEHPRPVAIDGRRILINGKPVFQRLILDQGLLISNR